MRFRFSAPWSTSLTTITLLLAGVGLVLVVTGVVIGVVILAAVVAVCAYYAVLGYVVEADAVAVRRPGWQTRLPLRDLESAAWEPEAFKGAIRTFGIGGPFAFVGFFRSQGVGSFRAYATDPERSVVLRWPTRTVVLTPDDPETFVAVVAAAAGLD